MDCVSEVTYRVVPLPQYAKLHDVFHISMLRKYIPYETHVIKFDILEIQTDLSFEKKSMQIVKYKEHNLRKRVVPMVQVQWQHHGIRRLLGNKRMRYVVNTQTYLVSCLSCKFRGRKFSKRGRLLQKPF